MIDPQLQNFVEQCRKLKIPEADIVKDLLDAGWDPGMVKQAVTSLKKDQVRLIHIHDLYKEYQPSKNLSIPAIRGIYNLDIFEGEFVAITGQSGSGKSTLLNLIGLVDDPSAGEIWIKDQNTASLNERQKTKLRLRTISFIFQFFNLLDNYTAAENIIFQLRLQHKGYLKAKEKALELLKFVNMDQKADFYPTEMSGGEQQRVAIARALAKDSQIILADEPTSHLDTKNSENIMSILRRVNLEYGKTIVLVTHEPDYAKLADRTINMADGKVINS